MQRKMESVIADLKDGESATIAAVTGGPGLQQRMRSVGIKESKKIRMVANHPFSGPVVVEVDRKQITIGRGMARHIMVIQAS